MARISGSHLRIGVGNLECYVVRGPRYALPSVLNTPDRFCAAPISCINRNQQDICISTHLENFNVRRVLGCSYPLYFVVLDFSTFTPTRNASKCTTSAAISWSKLPAKPPISSLSPNPSAGNPTSGIPCCRVDVPRPQIHSFWPLLHSN
jgi:hypothetical protein